MHVEVPFWPMHRVSFVPITSVELYTSLILQSNIPTYNLTL